MTEEAKKPSPDMLRLLLDQALKPWHDHVQQVLQRADVLSLTPRQQQVIEEAFRLSLERAAERTGQHLLDLKFEPGQWMEAVTEVLRELPSFSYYFEVEFHKLASRLGIERSSLMGHLRNIDRELDRRGGKRLWNDRRYQWRLELRWPLREAWEQERDRRNSEVQAWMDSQAKRSEHPNFKINVSNSHYGWNQKGDFTVTFEVTGFMGREEVEVGIDSALRCLYLPPTKEERAEQEEQRARERASRDELLEQVKSLEGREFVV